MVDVPVAKFAPYSRTGIIFKLDAPELVVMGLALSRPLFQLMITHNIGGAINSLFLWTLPLAIVAIGQYKGRSLLWYIRIPGGWLFRKITGQTKAVPKFRISKDESEIQIPGALGDRKKILPLRNVVGFPDAAFVLDRSPNNPTATAVLQFESEGWRLISNEAKAARVQAVSDLCREIARLEGVEQVGQWARTYEASHGLLPKPELYDEDSWVGAVTRHDYRDMIEHTPVGKVLTRDFLIAITISLKKSQKEIEAAGGGDLGISEVLVSKVTHVADMLPACGLRHASMKWLSRPKIRGALRLAFDPPAATFLAENNWDHPQGNLASYLQDNFDYVSTGTGYHRCWWVEEWPTVNVQAGFLYNLVARGQYSHTFAQIWRGVDLYQTEKKFNNDGVSRVFAERWMNKLGKGPDARHEAEGKDRELRWQELMQGYGDVEYSGWIVVHAESLDELNRSDRWLRDSAIGLRLNKSNGRQMATFATAALPVGFRNEYA